MKNYILEMSHDEKVNLAVVLKHEIENIQERLRDYTDFTDEELDEERKITNTAITYTRRELKKSLEKQLMHIKSMFRKMGYEIKTKKETL